MLGKGPCVLSSADFFFKIYFSKSIFSEIPSECKALLILIRPDDLGPKSLPRLLADATSK